MNEFDALCAEVESQPGAAERIAANVDRMNAVLELEKLRARAQFTQSALGERLGVSQRRVSAIEHAGEAVQLDTLRRYVEGLGGSLEVTAVIDGDRIQLPTR